MQGRREEEEEARRRREEKKITLGPIYKGNGEEPKIGYITERSPRLSDAH